MIVTSGKCKHILRLRRYISLVKRRLRLEREFSTTLRLYCTLFILLMFSVKEFTVFICAIVFYTSQHLFLFYFMYSVWCMLNIRHGIFEYLIGWRSVVLLNIPLFLWIWTQTVAYASKTTQATFQAVRFKTMCIITTPTPPLVYIHRCCDQLGISVGWTHWTASDCDKRSNQRWIQIHATSPLAMRALTNLGFIRILLVMLMKRLINCHEY